MTGLSSMQAAYWVGGHSAAASDRVSAHLYAEFDGPALDLDRLGDAVVGLYARHPMLRLAVSAEGMATIQPVGGDHRLQVVDLREQPEAQIATHLDRQRDQASHQRLDLTRAAGTQIKVTRLPNDRQRLHVDLDMIAVDPSSFPVLLGDLVGLYHGDDLPPLGPPPAPTAPVAADRRWWADRLASIPPAPALPAPSQQGTARTGLSTRRCASLSATETRALRDLACGLHVTPTALSLAVFSAVLGEALGQTRFRLNLPLFHRASDADGRVADVTDLTLFSADLRPGDSIAALATRSWMQMQGLLSHTTYPGVSLLRDLSRLTGRMEAAPVVFTSGIDTASGPVLAPQVRACLGDMVWVISQAPGVALDVQLAAVDDGLLINWDIRCDKIDMTWAERCFARFADALRALAADPRAAFAPLGASPVAPGPTESMLSVLIHRIAPDDPDAMFRDPHACGVIAEFLGRYIPQAAITVADISTSPSASLLASLVLNRSRGSSDTVATRFLAAVREAAPA